MVTRAQHRMTPGFHVATVMEAERFLSAISCAKGVDIKGTSPEIVGSRLDGGNKARETKFSHPRGPWCGGRNNRGSRDSISSPNPGSNSGRHLPVDSKVTVAQSATCSGRS